MGLTWHSLPFSARTLLPAPPRWSRVHSTRTLLRRLPLWSLGSDELGWKVAP